MTIGPRVNKLVGHHYQSCDQSSEQHGCQAFGGVKTLAEVTHSGDYRFSAGNTGVFGGEVGMYKTGHDEIL